MKLTKTTRVAKIKVPTETYLLEVENSSGDADDSKTVKTKFKEGGESYESLERLERILKVLKAFNKLSWNASCDARSDIDVFAAKVLEVDEESDPDGAYYAADDMYEAVGRDAVYGGMARPESYKLTYFDENGIEWNVKVEDL